MDVFAAVSEAAGMDVGPPTPHRVIYKYPLVAGTCTPEECKGDCNTEVVSLAMPAGAQVIRFDLTQTSMCIWAIVDPDVELETRRFTAISTGEPIPPGAEYIGTIVLRGSMFSPGDAVTHLFELKEGESAGG